MNRFSTLTMKDTVYGGYCYFPEHPLADLHGIVRFSIKTDHPLSAEAALAKYGVQLIPRSYGKIWGPSKSRVEQEVTSPDYGHVYFCRPALAYTHPSHYQKDLTLFVSIRQENTRLAKSEGHKVASAGPNKRKVDFP